MEFLKTLSLNVLRRFAIVFIAISCAAWKDEAGFDRTCRRIQAESFDTELKRKLTTEEAAIVCSCLRSQFSESPDEGDAIEADLERIFNGLPPQDNMTSLLFDQTSKGCYLSIQLHNNRAIESPAERAARQNKEKIEQRASSAKNLRVTCEKFAANRLSERPNQTGMIEPDDLFNAAAHDRQCAAIGIQLPPFVPR